MLYIFSLILTIGILLWLFSPAKNSTHVDHEYLQKFPFPAMRCDIYGNVLAVNDTLLKLFNLEPNKLKVMCKPKKKLGWRHFFSGKNSSYEEQLTWKTNQGTRTFLLTGHVNGKGPYCSLQELTTLEKTEKLLSLINKVK